jgi:hypothetical protein
MTPGRHTLPAVRPMAPVWDLAFGAELGVHLKETT